MKNCSSCSTENPETSQFCSKCGDALGVELAATVIENSAGRREARKDNGDSTGSSPSDTSIHGRFLPGTKIANRYRIVSLAGKGGMGEVYRADDLKLGHPVALKFLPPKLAANTKRLESFLNEVRLSRQVAHPNVCRVYDVGDVDTQHFLSMEYIDGEDLKVLLRRIGRLPKDKGIQIAQQLCAGLAAAHEKGVLHRDLKPANVMIDGRGQVRITDFGIARLADGAHTGEIAGTPAYMAPEQLAHGQTSIQSDLYSLGLILYELFTGQPAYKSGSIKEMLSAHEDSTPALPSALVEDLDPTVERVILRCLEKDPGQRPKSARAVAAGLPGGDPLAAALAAGETPSPEMVAAAGDEGAIKRWVGLACLAAVVIGLALVCWMAQSTHLVNRARLEKHPEFMAGDARRMIEKFGYHDKPADQAFGFRYEGRDTIRFWYRQHPTRAFSASDYWNVNSGPSHTRVSEGNPRWRDPGELGVELSPEGKLLRFRAVPPAVHDKQRGSDKPDWSQWFLQDFTGFDLTNLQPIDDMELRPPDAYDQLQVWKGQRPRTGDEFFVEAAVYSGKPVYFEVFSRPQFERAMSSPLRRPRTQQLGDNIFFSLYIGMVVVAAVLAWRNFASRRSDRKGAFRVAFYLFGSGTLTWVLIANHTASGREMGILEVGLAQALFPAAEFWLGYTALEPFVRRLWPQLLISWSRLIEGRWRDPLVGRDVLVGTLLGIAVASLNQLRVLAPLSWFGLAAQSFQISNPLTLAGLLPLFGGILSIQVFAVLVALFNLMLLFCLRCALRKTLLASCVFILVATTQTGLSSGAHHAAAWFLQGLGFTLLVWALVQFGFLTIIVSTFSIELLLQFPLTTDFSAWYAGYGLTAMAIVLSIAAFGFYTSKGSQPIFSGELSK